MNIKNILSTAVLATLLIAPTSANACGFFGLFCTDPVMLQTKIVPTFVQLVPTFENVNVVTKTTRGEYVVQANNTYFASVETATQMAQRFGAIRVELRESIQNLGANYLYADGPLKGTAAFYRVLIFGPNTVLKNNVGDIEVITTQQFEVNVGVLADYFRRMPEKEFPPYTSVFGNPPVETHFLSLAEQYVWRVLNQINPAPAPQILFFKGTPREKDLAIGDSIVIG